MKIFGVDFTWSLLGYNVLRDASGAVMIGGGLGYFISYETGSFVAQCINFPLQRNITFKSHGNPWYQAMWYFIAWIAISLICNGFNNLWMPIASALVPPAVYNILISEGQFELLLPESDEREYLGETFCSEEEKMLSYLAEFPPLNYCCYSSVPEQYLVPSYPQWQVSERHLSVMNALAEEAGDRCLKRWLSVYAKCPCKIAARQIARMLHTVRHGAAVDLIGEKLARAAAVYGERVFKFKKAGFSHG